MSREIPSFEKTENKEQIQELKHFTLEQVNEINKRLEGIESKLRGKGYGNGMMSLTLKDHEGNARRFGIGGGMGYDATAFNPDQVIAALAIVGHDFDKEKVFDFSDGSKPLGGLKILDLGCGVQPEFSYIARRLGAETWTVDVIPASEFQPIEISEEGKPIDERAAEFHIQIDLNNPDAAQKILEKANGKFNFVTEAHLSTGTMRTIAGRERDYAAYGEDTAKDVLIDEGVYQKVEPLEVRVRHAGSLKY